MDRIVECEMKGSFSDAEVRGAFFMSTQDIADDTAIIYRIKFAIPWVEKFKNTGHRRTISSFTDKSIMRVENSNVKNNNFNVIDSIPSSQKGNSGGWKTVVE